MKPSGGASLKAKLTGVEPRTRDLRTVASNAI
jgi:hypothetical protein